jgi:hypothetical protein
MVSMQSEASMTGELLNQVQPDMQTLNNLIKSNQYDGVKKALTELFNPAKDKGSKAEKILCDIYKAVLFSFKEAPLLSNISQNTVRASIYGKSTSTKLPGQLNQVFQQAQNILVAYSADLNNFLKNIQILMQDAQLSGDQKNELNKYIFYIESLNRQAICLYDTIRNYQVK